MSLQYDKILPKGKLLGRLTEKQKSCVYFYDAHRTSEKVKTEGNKYWGSFNALLIGMLGKKRSIKSTFVDDLVLYILDSSKLPCTGQNNVSKN